VTSQFRISAQRRADMGVWSIMGRIVDIQMTREKLLDERKIVVTLEPSAREWLAEIRPTVRARSSA
jgi:hypothetical protein